MALSDAPKFSATQWQIVHYSRIAGIGMSVAIGVPTLAYIFAPYNGNARLAVTAIAAALSIAAWLQFDRWCQRQVLCAICQRSVFHRWILELSIGFWRSFYGVPEKCPHCGARLP